MLTVPINMAGPSAISIPVDFRRHAGGHADRGPAFRRSTNI